MSRIGNERKMRREKGICFNKRQEYNSVLNTRVESKWFDNEITFIYVYTNVGLMHCCHLVIMHACHLLLCIVYHATYYDIVSIMECFINLSLYTTKYNML